MPDIAVFHPHIVHFVIGLLFVGVAARLVSLLPLGGRLSFMGPMAALLILLGTGASLLAVHSGLDAHGPAERVPGARDAVVEHEEWGERARNAFIVVALLELAALALASRKRVATGLRLVSAAAGLAGLVVLYQASEHGGALVYDYAGGVGIRSGDPADVRRLLVAGLYHNVQAARDSGRKEDAARLTDELMRQMPADAGVKFLGVESLIKDREDPHAALATLATMDVPADDRRLQIRKAMLTIQAYRAAGMSDSAQATIEEMKRRYPNDPRIKAALARLGGAEGGSR
ncbi:MAG: DUF2231 domain-containing protein [Candidatus Eisenbacteria bacterium]